MAKASILETVSSTFGISPGVLSELGVLDATLAIDTKLFFDPLLLPTSEHDEIRVSARRQYRAHFEQVISLLAASKGNDDVAWRAARRQLRFPEVRGTCLGYGAGSIHGSGFGPQLTEQTLTIGKEIVDLGIRDPDLFTALALFESRIGPDRISDMTTTVIRQSLVEFNRRILRELNLAGELFDLAGIEGQFLVNRFERKRTPVILVPSDVLRRLPIARDWDGVAHAAAHNESLRARVNRHVGHIWARKTKRDRKRLRQQATASKESFQTLLDAIKAVPLQAYDIHDDPDGLLKWVVIAREYAASIPLKITSSRKPHDIASAHRLVKSIVEAFRHLIEHKGLNKDLYRSNGKPHHEANAQRLFHAIAYSYCKAENLDLSPEVDTGTGKIDFKFSQGFDCRVLVEIKLSTNSSLVDGYAAQLETYKKAEETMRAVYLVLDVGKLERKHDALIKLRNDSRDDGSPLSDLEFVDARIKPSASKRRRTLRS